MLPSLETREDNDTAVGQTSSAVEVSQEPLVGVVFSLLVIIGSLSLLSAFFAQRFVAITSWRKLPLVGWLIFAIYIDSWLFVSIATVLRYGPGINTSWDLCATAIFLCLSCYISTKLIYLFLVEKAFVVWGGGKSRLQSKLYIFNAFGMLSIFAVIGVLNFMYRIAYVRDGHCIIGMQRPVLIPLVSFDLAVNVYLTVLFLIPLRKLNAFNPDQTSGNAKLRVLVRRTFIGAVTSTLSCLLNIVIMMALDGEPGWVCLLSCNIDLLFDAIIVQYVTSPDNSGTQKTDADDKNLAVAVERSVIIYRSANRVSTGKHGRTWSSLDHSKCWNDKNPTLTNVEEDTMMPNLGGPPAGRPSSTDTLKGVSGRSSVSLDDLDEFGNQTNVTGAGGL